jgi:hypothetical protein
MKNSKVLTDAKELLQRLEPAPPSLVMVLGRKDGEVFVRSATIDSGYPEDVIITISRNDEDKAYFETHTHSELAELTRKKLIDEKQ